MHAFALLFRRVCFGRHHSVKRSDRLVEDVMELIERCHTESQPTMEDVVKEMETWNLT
ncbi:hypothetical protein M378DRAFT_466174 [Amanita muscaria Koide BX008]|uniref:Uncharacterized protein n=1 Tax=Amanita muscaria (strain Koide BX008) TaxID=946122 RepID=A0A0C2S1N1_AMAMK|nr:hypothetical protein M378DRAFT_466174 [Amanita muscaria Koide BX008]